MAIYFVHRRNNYFPLGVYVKTVGMGMVQRVKMNPETRELSGELEGIAVPLRDMRGSLLRIQENGMDPESRLQ